jgi:GNAT superfamily N-acetyltransferase
MTGQSTKLIARITHLEMSAPPQQRVPIPLGRRLAVMKVTSIPLHFYRYLYEQVGRPHHWLMRRGMDDNELASILHASSCAIEVIYVDGAPGGFFELDLSMLPDTADIVYFGLMPDFQGRGIGRFFLSTAVLEAWSHAPGRVLTDTNSLDSPRALQLYQQMGFEPVGWSEEEIEPWT